MFHSDRTSDECRSALIASTSTNLFRSWGKGMFRSQVPWSDAITLWRRTPWVRNSFRTMAVVRCLAGDSGTVISVTLRSHYLVAGFISFWLAGVLLFNIVVFYNAAFTSFSPVDVVPLLFPAFGVGLIAFGRLLARADGPALLDFIRQTTGAQDPSSDLRPFC
jgi:hypothetical protein